MAVRDIRSILSELGGCEILNGQFLTDDKGLRDVKLTNGAVNKLKHRLGRALGGYLVVDLRNVTTTGRFERLTESGSAKADDSRDLWLDVQGWGTDPTVRIWVF